MLTNDLVNSEIALPPAGLRARLVSAALAALAFISFLAPADALAREEIPIRLGQRVWGELSSGEELTVGFHGLPDTSVRITLGSWRGTTLLADLALVGPDGLAVDLGPYLRSNRRGTIRRVRRLRLAKAGTYHLTVRGQPGTTGGFNLFTTGAYRKRSVGKGEVVASGVAVPLPFFGLSGDRATCIVRRLGRSKLRGVVARHVDASGAVNVIGRLTRGGPVTLASPGEHAFEVEGFGGTTGAFRYTIRLRPARASREWQDVRDLSATGSVSGRLLFGPQAGGIGPGKAAGRLRRPRTQAELRPGELIVSVPGAHGDDEVLAALRRALPDLECELLQSMTENGPHLVQVAGLSGRRYRRRDTAQTRAIAKAASVATDLAWIEPNYLGRAAREPNDPGWPLQNDFRVMRVPEAWEFTTGSPDVTIAVIDSGIWDTHPEFAGRLLPGYDFVTSVTNAADGSGWDSNPRDSGPSFHGTHVAGTIGAASDNQSGVAGTVWDARIVAVRTLGRDGRGTYFDIAAGVRWAAGLPVSGAPANSNPARVINMSLGGSASSPVLQDAVAAALQAGAVIVAAAGNDDTNQKSYPAAYPGVIAVAAVAPDLWPASYSNYGSWVTVSAPGGDLNRGQAEILSLWVDKQLRPSLAELQGTSMAAPHVAGVAALMLAVNPDLTPAEVKTILEQTAFDLWTPGFDPYYGFGLVDAELAVRRAAELVPVVPVLAWAPQVLEFGRLTDELDVHIRNTGEGGIAIQGVSASGPAWLSATLTSGSAPAVLTVRVNQATLAESVYTGTVTVQTDAGDFAVPVRVNRKPAPVPGFARIEVIGENGQTVASTGTSASNGWNYTIEDLPPGTYRIIATVDQDGDLQATRVDEWEGVWPLHTSPATVDVVAGQLDHTGLDFGLRRLDQNYQFDGAGGGQITGAVAVRVFDGLSLLPIPDANVYVGNAVYSSTTDAEGRAVVRGAFSGAQMISVTAPGYAPLSQAGSNAQYQSFGLSPTDPPSFDVTVTVSGLDPWDESVLVKAGSESEWVVYDGVNAPTATFRLPQRRQADPVWVLTYDDLGDISKVALDTVGPVLADRNIDVDVFAFEPSDLYWFVETAVLLPEERFEESGAYVEGAVQLYWTAFEFLPIGVDELIPDVASEIRWASFDELDSSLATTLSVTAYDTLGRGSQYRNSGTVDSVGTPVVVDLLSPPGLSAPIGGTSVGSAGVTLEFAPTSNAQVNIVRVWDSVTEQTWALFVSGGASSVTLPVLPGAGLVPGRTYWWQVSSWRIPGITLSFYFDDAFTTRATDITWSEWESFVAQ